MQKQTAHVEVLDSVTKNLDSSSPTVFYSFHWLGIYLQLLISLSEMVHEVLHKYSKRTHSFPRKILLQ